MMKMHLCLLLSVMLLAGCDSIPDAPPTVYVAPPDQILKCEDEPSKPNPETATSKDAAKYITKLHFAWQDCSQSLKSVRDFVQESVQN